MNLKHVFSQLPTGRIAGSAGVSHGEGQPAAEAHVGWPIGVVRWADGDLIVADWPANRLWRIAGDGVPGDRGDGRRRPRRACADHTAWSSIATATSSPPTWKIARYAASTPRLASSPGSPAPDGPALECELDVHCGMAVDADDNVYLSSEWQNTIRKIDAKTGIIELFAGHDARHYASEWGAATLTGPGSG